MGSKLTKIKGQVSHGSPCSGGKMTFSTTKTSDQVVEIFSRHFYNQYPIDKALKLELFFTDDLKLLTNKISKYWIRFDVEFDDPKHQNFYVTYYSSTPIDTFLVYTVIGNGFDEIYNL